MKTKHTKGATEGFAVTKKPSIFSRISSIFGKKAASSSPAAPRVLSPSKVVSSNVSNENLKSVGIKIAALNTFITAVNADSKLNKLTKARTVSQLGLIRANIIGLSSELSTSGWNQQEILNRIDSEYAKFKDIYNKENLGRYNPKRK